MPELIPVNAILPVRNNREDFSHVPGLSQSIVASGQKQAIELCPLSPEDPLYRQPVDFSFTIQGTTKSIVLMPEYTLIAGESRWRAHIWANLPTIKAEVNAAAAEDEKIAMMGTMIENVSRKELTIIEQSNGYNTLLDLGYTIDDIAKGTGQKVDFIQKRVNLKNLNLEYKEMAHKGQLTIEYAAALSSLNSEYQYQAITELVAAGDKATVHWFRKVCGRLLEKQNSFSLFDMALFGGGPTSADNGKDGSLAAAGESINTLARQPVNPALYSPNFASGREFREVIADALAEMEYSRVVWAEYCHTEKVMLCDNMIKQYAAILENLPETKEQPHIKIKRLLSERGKMTRREIAQFGNMSVNEVMENLDRLPISSVKVGKKVLYCLA